MTALHQGSGDDLGQHYLGKIRRTLPGGLGMLLLGILLLIVTYASVAYVPAGNVGVLKVWLVVG